MQGSGLLEVEMKFKIGKRYLTRDWKVVRYDGSQDVVARVYAHKPGRFAEEDHVGIVGNEDGQNYPIVPGLAGQYNPNWPKGERFLMVRVSDLPDDMKDGPKP